MSKKPEHIYSIRGLKNKAIAIEDPLSKTYEEIQKFAAELYGDNNYLLVVALISHESWLATLDSSEKKQTDVPHKERIGAIYQSGIWHSFRDRQNTKVVDWYLQQLFVVDKSRYYVEQYKK